jgi:hypothetical protein
MGMILLNPFLPLQTTTSWVMSWVYYLTAEANFDLCLGGGGELGKTFLFYAKVKKPSRSLELNTTPSNYNMYWATSKNLVAFTTLHLGTYLFHEWL